MAKLSSLIVDLQANTASLKTGLDEANGMLSKFGEKVDEAGKALVELFAVEKLVEGIHKIGEMVLEASEAAGQMARMGAAAGMSVESFSRLAFAARMVGVPTEELSAGMNHLNKAIGQVAQGSSEQTALFSALGVSVRDASGHLRGGAEVLGDLADRFAAMEDGPAKSALAMEVFGKSGASLIPVLNKGRQGLAELGGEADKFGQTISTQAAEQLETFNQSVLKLKTVGDGLAKQIAQDLAPSLAALAAEFEKAMGSGDALKETAHGIAEVFRGLVSVGLAVGFALKELVTGIGALGMVVWKVLQRDLLGAKEVANAWAEDYVQNTYGMADRIKAVWTDHATTVKEATSAAGDATRLSAEKIEKAVQRQKMAIEQAKAAFKSLKETAESMQFEAVTHGMDVLQKTIARLTIGDLADKLKQAGPRGGQFKQDILTAAQSQLDQQKADERATADEEAYQRVRKELIDRKLWHEELGREMLKEGREHAALANAIRNEAEDQVLGAMGAPGKALGGLIKGDFITSIIALLGQMDSFSSIVSGMTRIMKVIGNAIGGPQIQPITDIINMIASVFETLEPAIALFERMTMFATQPLMLLAELALPTLFGVLKFVGMITIQIARALANAWNGVLQAIEKILSDVASVLGILADPLKAIITGLQTLEDHTDYDSALKNLHDMTYQDAIADNTNALDGNTKKIKEVTESISNVPDWFKVAGVRWNSADVPGMHAATPVVNVFIGSRQIRGALKADQQSVAYTKWGTHLPQIG